MAKAVRKKKPGPKGPRTPRKKKANGSLFYDERDIILRKEIFEALHRPGVPVKDTLSDMQNVFLAIKGTPAFTIVLPNELEEPVPHIQSSISDLPRWDMTTQGDALQTEQKESTKSYFEGHRPDPALI